MSRITPRKKSPSMLEHRSGHRHTKVTYCPHASALPCGAETRQARWPISATKLMGLALQGVHREPIRIHAGNQPVGRHQGRQAEVLPLDAKMNFDSNALYRHPEIVELRDEDEEDPMELEASKHDLNYVASSTAPLAAWSTAPALRWRPWTSSSSTAASRRTSSMSAAAPRSETRHHRVQDHHCRTRTSKGILVNIFGGIMKCDVIAEGVIAAVKDVGLSATCGAPRRQTWWASPSQQVVNVISASNGTNRESREGSSARSGNHDCYTAIQRGALCRLRLENCTMVVRLACTFI